MIPVWRIDKTNRSKQESFSGKGAALEGGRWNKPGALFVYAAETLSLAALEKLVHMGDEGRGLALVSYEIEISSDIKIEELERKRLPHDWKTTPIPQSTQDIGTQWIEKAGSAIFKVPSVIIDTEHNYLLNPLHPDFKRLKISLAKPFRFDDRLRQKYLL